MIKSVGRGQYVVVSERTGRRLSRPLSRKAAQRRLRQVEYFKRHRPGR